MTQESPKKGDLVISETATSTWNYHLRVIGAEGFMPGGGAPPALCGQMSVILKDVPGGYDWGWFSREDRRMHLQTVDNKHRNQHKVWLENRGTRRIEYVGPVPGKVRRALEDELAHRRSVLEAQWTSFMIQKGWLGLSFSAGVVTLTAYPGSAEQFVRTVDLAAHFPGVPSFQASDVALCEDPASIALWPDRAHEKRGHIDLVDVLWKDP